MPSNEVPYVSCWIALDEMTEENGCLYMLPYPNPKDSIIPSSSSEFLQNHKKLASQYETKENYEENMIDNVDDGIEIPIIGKNSSQIT